MSRSRWYEPRGRNDARDRWRRRRDDERTGVRRVRIRGKRRSALARGVFFRGVSHHAAGGARPPTMYRRGDWTPDVTGYARAMLHAHLFNDAVQRFREAVESIGGVVVGQRGAWSPDCPL